MTCMCCARLGDQMRKVIRPGAILLLLTALAACVAATPSTPQTGRATWSAGQASPSQSLDPFRSTTRSQSGRPSTLTLPPLERLPSETLSTPGAPGALLWAYGSIWVMAHRDSTLFRVDPVTAKVNARIDTGVYGCGDIVAGARSVWVTGCGATPGLIRIDPRTNRVQATARLTGAGPAFIGGELWISSAAKTGGDDLRRADPDRLDAARSMPVAGLVQGDGLVAAAGSIWVGDETSAIVYRVNPASEVVEAAIPMPVEADTGYLIRHDDAPWYIDTAKGALVRIDPKNGNPTLLRVRTARPWQYWGIAASTAPGPAGRLWVRHGNDEAWLVDTRADRVIRRVATADGAGGDLQEAGGALWIAHFGNDQIQRISLKRQPR